MASTVAADSMTTILMVMDLHLEDLWDLAALMVRQVEILEVRVVAQVTVRQAEGIPAEEVGIAETSSVKVLVGTKTGIQSGLDIRRQPVTLIPSCMCLCAKGDCICGSVLWRAGV